MNLVHSFHNRWKDIWKWLHAIWDDIEWPLILILSLITTILGAKGFSDYFSSTGIKNFNTWDCIYSAIQLFSLESGNIAPEASLPLSLQIARFLAPSLAAYTIFQALKEIFSKQVLLFNLWKIRNHYIVAGLGDKGFRLVSDLRKEDKPVVAIEIDENNPHLDTCKELGALVLVGDAREKLLLRRAGIRRASHLIAVCGDDGINTEITVLTKELTQKDLTCTIHITDPYLWGILKEQEFMVQESSEHFRLELFNIYDSGARYLLRETLFSSNTLDQPPALLIVGTGMLAEYLILHAAQFWAFHYGAKTPSHKKSLVIYIVAPSAEQDIARLQVRYPIIKNTCQLFSYNQAADELTMPENFPAQNVTHAYICLEDTFSGLQTSFSLLEWADKKNVQIMVRMTEDAGLASLLKTSRQLELSPINAFGLLDTTCRLSLFDDGTHENLARAIHEHYLQEELSKGKELYSTPALQPWEALSAELKQSNLHQADHIGTKLRAVNCGIKPWVSGNATTFEFSSDEIETMAQLEHDRWMKEKKAQGWQLGQRDNENKRHPDLLSWENLPENAREKNRQAVRQIPLLLARAGFQIYRIPQKPIS